MRKVILVMIALFLTAAILAITVSARERKIQEEEDFRQIMIEACLADAYSSYSESWNNQCHAIGERDDCMLINWKVQLLNESHEKAKDRCIERFKK